MHVTLNGFLICSWRCHTRSDDSRGKSWTAIPFAHSGTTNQLVIPNFYRYYKSADLLAVSYRPSGKKTKTTTQKQILPRPLFLAQTPMCPMHSCPLPLSYKANRRLWLLQEIKMCRLSKWTNLYLNNTSVQSMQVIDNSLFQVNGWVYFIVYFNQIKPRLHHPT